VQEDSVVGFAYLKINRFILEQFDGQAQPLNGVIQILAIDRLRAIVNVGDDPRGGQGVLTGFIQQVVTIHLIESPGDGDDAL
jgi:hypothetical protein